MSRRRLPCDTLVVVKTPLQILNAIEARHSFGFANAALRFLTSRKFTREMMLALVDPDQWQSIASLEFDLDRRVVRLPWVKPATLDKLTEKTWMLQQWRRRQRFDAFLRPWRGVPNLIIGNYHQPHFMHLANRFRDSRCILIDDGTDTLRVAAARRTLAATAMAPPAGLNIWRSPRQYWRHRQVAWDMRPRPELVFFSTYDLELPRNDTLVQNAYECARARLHAARSDGRVIFLGQPLVEDGYLRAEDFRALLRAVRRSHDRQPLVYVPHPREDRATLIPTLEDCGFKAQEIGRPFEFFLLEGATVPAVVASFFSSALDNCRLIFGDRIRLIAYRLDPAALLTGREFVAEVYEYFATRPRRGIEILTPGLPASPTSSASSQ